MVAAAGVSLGRAQTAARDATAPRAPLLTMARLVQQSHSRPVQAYDTQQVQQHLRRHCPHRLRSSRVVELLPRVRVPLLVCGQRQLGTGTASSFSAAPALAVCHTARSGPHHVCAVAAARGTTAVGWFYGCQLHLLVTDRGERVALCLTPRNGDHRRPVPWLLRRLVGTRFGDRADRSQALAHDLLVPHGWHLITTARTTRHTRRLSRRDTLLVRPRALLASIVDQLTNGCPIAPTPHRSPLNFLVTLLAGLRAYCHHPTNPSLDLGLPALLTV